MIGVQLSRLWSQGQRLKQNFRGLENAMCDVVWVRSLLTELGLCPSHVHVLWCDNTITISIVVNLVQHAKMKHVELDLFFVREKVSQGIVQLKHIPGSDQIADALTKPLTEKFFIHVRTELGVCSFSEALAKGSCVFVPLFYLDSIHQFSASDVV